MGALGRIVSNVDQLDEVVGFIEQLGRDHRRFSVVTEHYSAVGASLLATSGTFLAPPGRRTSPPTGRLRTASSPGRWCKPQRVPRRTVRTGGRGFVIGGTQDARSSRREGPDGPTLALPGGAVGGGRGSAATAAVALPQPGQRATPRGLPSSTCSWSTEARSAPASSATSRQVTASRSKRGGELLTRPADRDRDLLLVAGGSGLAPLRAVLEEIDGEFQRTGSAPEVHLYHGVRMPWSLRTPALDLACRA